ncbi:MAG: hypothetical protein FD162_2435 [Rhodobacteraceae bacterium]|uniref:hypothetical protein n=1 Tax=Cypionkella sp. TaxID=2811411 RepID=UPI00132A26E2|nr:hypothetical protein [Cypionkella sp.]KAF0172338.1 MAG: hypothetical protein FD162_2435 [Paracoccaceae bacterium]MDO8327501.1 hypothetical protein [Cypionkella sp.]
MNEPHPKPRDLGLLARQNGTSQVTAPEWAAAGLSLVWVLAVAAYFFTGSMESGVLGFVLVILAVFLPLALIWAVVTTLRSVRSLRAEAARLQATVEAMRAAYVSNQQAGTAMKPSVERKLDEIAAAARHTETALASFNSRRDTGLTVPSADRKAVLVQPAPQPEAEQPGLALGTPAEDLRAPLSVTDFVRAVQFPESPDDKEGFRALRLALENRDVAKLIRAAQDVLTLLSQEGIFMDDLKPDRARPELWRKFAAGERGRGIAALGGVRDRSSLALTAGRMREDPIFRDAAHHFLRTFDRTFSEFEKHASDADLADLADTRTARAFMLLGRVTGTFD